MKVSTMQPLAQSILQFWFGAIDSLGLADEQHSRHWFEKDPAFDKQIKNKFEPLLEHAGMGAYDRWSLDPNERLALIILMDQFPRNIFRNSPRAFYYDAKALVFAVQGIEADAHLKMPTSYALFQIMPTMHAEDLPMQDLGIAAFSKLLELAPETAKSKIKYSLEFAKQHRAIVERFGRFPHRNAVLARTSSAEEIEFLKQPGSNF